MKVLHSVALLLCVITAHAQSNVDSLFSKAYRFYEARQYDSSIHYFNSMLRLTSNKDSRASALNAIGVAYSAKGFPDKSIPYYREAISLYEELHDTTTLITITNNLAIIYKDKGLYENALEISFNALPELESQPPGRPLASSYNTIGTVYLRIQDYAKSYEYYRKSLSVRLAINYEQGVAQSYNNLGELFNEKKEFDSALVNLNKAVAIRKKINDNRGLGRTLTLIGHSLTYSGKPGEAEGQLKTAIELSRSSDDLIAEILALHELGFAYIAMKDPKNAERSLDDASILIERSKNNGYLKRNLELHADLYRFTADRLKLINTLERLIVVKDSVFSEEKMETLLALEIQYETEKKEQEIALLQEQRKADKVELEKNQQRVIFLIVLAVSLVIVASLGYRLFFVTQREKKNSEMHNSEMHHRTKNNMQMLSSFFTIQASLHDDDKKAQELIVDMQGRVKTMALVHSKLYNKTEASELELRTYLTDLVKSLLYTYGFTGNKLNLNLDLVEVSIDIDRAIKVGLIVNELITNTLKYAYGSQNTPSLRIALSKEDKSLVLEVTDNGKHSLPVDVFELGGAFGLKMVKSFVREMNGNIELRNIDGTSFLITIPDI